MRIHKTKKLIASIMTLASIWCVLAAKVSIDPIYQDARFTPANTLHAWCLNSADIVFQSELASVENIHLVMSYNPQDIQIVRIASEADKSLINYNVENDRIILNYLNANWEKLSNNKIFKIYFKWSESLTWTSLIIDKWSYALSKWSEKIELSNKTNLSFDVAQECEPDDLAPIISLSVPQDTQAKLPLDAYFSWDVKDIWKWVDKNSVEIEFGWKKYSWLSENIKWNWDYLFFYPENWLPIDQKMVLQVSVSDSQKYGGANISRKQFKFETVTGMVLQNNVSPAAYRNVVKKSATIAWSDLECKVLKQVYAQGNDNDRALLKNVLRKLICDTSDIALIMEETSLEKVRAGSMIAWNSDDENFSVLAVVWWVLFFIALALKIHYYIVYRKQKHSCACPRH